MFDLFTNLTSDYKVKKMVTNMPLPYIEHLQKRAKRLMLHTSEVVRYCLGPDIVDFLLGFSNKVEEKKVEERIPSHKGGFYIKPPFKYWHSW